MRSEAEDEVVALEHELVDMLEGRTMAAIGTVLTVTVANLLLQIRDRSGDAMAREALKMFQVQVGLLYEAGGDGGLQ